MQIIAQRPIGSVVITGSSGKALVPTLEHIADNIVTINVASLSAGVYVIEILGKDGKSIARKKFVKQ